MPNKDQLEDFDNEYFWRTRKHAQEAEHSLRLAQENFQRLNTLHVGCAEMIKAKYDLKDTDRVLPDGKIERK